MELVELSRDRLAERDELVRASREGTVFHSSWWLRAHAGAGLSNVADGVRYVGLCENGRFVAGMPLTYRRVLGRRLILPPYVTPYLGPFHEPNGTCRRPTEYSRHKEFNSLFAKAVRDTGTLLSYPFNHGVTDLQPYIWAGFNPTVRYTYVLDISDLDRAVQGFDKKLRNVLCKFERDGFTVVPTGLDTVKQLMRETFELKGKRRFDVELAVRAIGQAALRHQAASFATLDGAGAVVSAGAMVWDNKRAYMLASGTRRGDRSAKSGLRMHCLRYAAETLALREFDFEGSMIPSIEYFFRAWGAELRPVLGIGGVVYTTWLAVRRVLHA